MSNTLRKKTFNNYGTSLICDSVISNFFDNFIKCTNLNLDEPIVDIGCGFGRASGYLAKKGGKKIFAVDLSDDNIQKVKEDYSTLVKDQIIVPIVGDFSENDTFPHLSRSREFSLALLINVVHFWEEKKLIANLNKIWSLLHDNGYLIMLTQVNLDTDSYLYPLRFNFHPAFIKTILLDLGFKRVFIDNDSCIASKYITIACKAEINLAAFMAWCKHDIPV